MSFFAEQTRVVELDADNRVTLRKLTYGQAREATSRAMRVDFAKQTPEIDYPLLRAEQLHRAVVSWDGPGFEGREVTAANIDALPTWITDKLIDGLVALDGGAGDDEGNASGAPTNS